MSLYYESHITVEPVLDERLDRMKELCKNRGFKVADLLMQKRRVDTPARSRYDTFCTGRHKDLSVLMGRMKWLVEDLIADGFTVWRYKIEDALLDSKYVDTLGVVGETEKHLGDVLSEV